MGADGYLQHAGEEDQAYFRKTREAAFKMPLEEVVADREGRIDQLKPILTPIRLTLKHQPFMGGDKPDVCRLYSLWRIAVAAHLFRAFPCWKRMIRSWSGSSACWISMTAWAQCWRGRRIRPVPDLIILILPRMLKFMAWQTVTMRV